MKQVNPKYNLKLGASFDESNVSLDDFNDSQITQLYELFLETNKNKRLSNAENQTNNKQ